MYVCARARGFGKFFFLDVKKLSAVFQNEMDFAVREKRTTYIRDNVLSSLISVCIKSQPCIPEFILQSKRFGCKKREAKMINIFQKKKTSPVQMKRDETLPDNRVKILNWPSLSKMMRASKQTSDEFISYLKSYCNKLGQPERV